MNLSIILEMLKKEQIYIYGAGVYARQVCAFLQQNMLMHRIKGVVVSKDNQEKNFWGRPLYIYKKNKFSCDDIFCIAIKDADEIISQLESDGIHKIYVVTEEIIDQMRLELFQEISKKTIIRKKIFFDSFGGKGYGCNPKYVAEYLRKQDGDVALVWGIQKCAHTDLPSEIKQVEYGSYEYYLDLYTSGIVIGNVGIPTFPYKRKEQYVIQTWHGSGSYKKAGADLLVGDIRAIDDLRMRYANVDLCVSNTAGNTKMFREAFFFKGEIAEYGSPRVDIVFQNEGFREKICRKLKIPKDKKILLYAPTFRDSVATSFKYYDIDMSGILEQLAKRFGGEYVLIYRFHQKLYQYEEGKNYYPYGKNITMYPDVMEFLVAADVLITDYSSIMWDFGLQRRPIFLYQNDAKQYTDDRGFYKPISTWPYPIAHTQKELLENIQRFDEQDYLNKLEAFIAADPSYDDGHATERVVARIMDVIEHPEKYGKE